MYRLFRSELLKSKRTLLRPTLFIGAVIFSVLLMIVANLAPDALEKSWEHYTKMIFNMWTISFNTLGISLLCILTEYTEKKNNTYDIQTPATVVSGNLELLEETNMDVNQKEYVKYAQDGISKISEYVEELKTLSKLEQPKTEYVHFNEKYVDNLILLANQIARLKNVTVSVIQKDWTDDLLIEPKDIQKAFQNIISNAVGFSEKSSQIKLKFINNKSEYIVSVIDNGKGFSKESLEKATQKFYSENKARSGSHYGLGLSIVEKIMNEHSGFLQIENLEVDNIIVGAKVSLIFKLK